MTRARILRSNRLENVYEIGGILILRRLHAPGASSSLDEAWNPTRGRPLEVLGMERLFSLANFSLQPRLSKPPVQLHGFWRDIQYGCGLSNGETHEIP